MSSTIAPQRLVGLAKVSVESNGPICREPPITKPSRKAVALSSCRIETCTVASNALLEPRNLTGEVMVASAAGSVSLMFGVAAPRTDHEPSVPSWRTMTVVTGPAAFARIGYLAGVRIALLELTDDRCDEAQVAGRERSGRDHRVVVSSGARGGRPHRDPRRFCTAVVVVDGAVDDVVDDAGTVDVVVLVGDVFLALLLHAAAANDIAMRSAAAQGCEGHG